MPGEGTNTVCLNRSRKQVTNERQGHKQQATNKTNGVETLNSFLAINAEYRRRLSYGGMMWDIDTIIGYSAPTSTSLLRPNSVPPSRIWILTPT